MSLILWFFRYPAGYMMCILKLELILSKNIRNRMATFQDSGWLPPSCAGVQSSKRSWPWKQGFPLWRLNEILALRYVDF